MAKNNRQRMRESHHKAISWLMNAGFDMIHVKSHGRLLDIIYSKELIKNSKGEDAMEVKWAREYKQKVYMVNAIDIWNQADFICIRKKDGKPFLVQVKSESGSLDSVIEKAKYGLYNRFNGLNNFVGFIAIKPVKSKGSKVRCEYKIL